MSASVLFDAPGPKARTRHLILTVIGALLALAGLWVVIGKMRQAGQRPTRSQVRPRTGAIAAAKVSASMVAAHIFSKREGQKFMEILIFDITREEQALLPDY